MKVTRVEVERRNFAVSRTTSEQVGPIGDGDILARIDMFALTANNVSYALSGEGIGYWRFFPAEPPWGVVPVWGFADVIESRRPAVPVGTRFWGFLPMASHCVMRPDKVSPRGFIDASEHRRELPSIYNAYQVTNGDPPGLQALEAERCLLFPLFSTSYVLYDYLVDNAFFGARRIIIGGASSKTGIGLAKLLREHAGDRPLISGLASDRSRAFLSGIKACDEILLYAEAGSLAPDVPSVFVDMSGDGPVIENIHQALGDALRASIAVGATHWGAERYRNKGRVPHTFFFAPAHFAKRDADWGAGEIRRRAQDASIRMAREVSGILRIEHATGAQETAAAFSALVRAEKPADSGIMARIPDEG